MNDPIVTTTVNKGSQLKENTMKPEILNRMANIAIEDMKRAASRLTEIQDACTHKDDHVELVGGFLQVTCKTCYVVIGIPTHEQIRNAGYTI